MTELTTGWRAVLSHPRVYEAVQHAVGARSWLRRFVQETVKPIPGQTMIDIGCGPAAILNYLPEVDYCGFDHSEAYIAAAKKRFGSRPGVRFFCADASAFQQFGVGPFEIATAIGLLHHLDDKQVLDLFVNVREMLTPDGHLFTADPCYFDGQPRITRRIISSDRGQHVRSFDSYLALGRKVFPAVTASLTAGLFPFPHAVCEVTCSGK